MKELTIEEKAEIYNEVRKKIALRFGSNVAEEIFSEFEMSEDEKMRKAIIDFFSEPGRKEYILNGFTIDDIIAWLEKQGQVKESEIPQPIKETSKENDNSLTKKAWSEEDERILQCLIRDQEKALDDVRNDKYGHSEIISDLKEMYRERIDWLKQLKQRHTWKPSKGQLECLDVAIDKVGKDHSPFFTNRAYLTLKALKEQLKKLTE